MTNSQQPQHHKHAAHTPACCSESYFMLVYVTFSKLLDVSNYVFPQRQDWKMKRVMHNLWKLKAPRISFQLSFALKDISALYWFFLFLFLWNLQWRERYSTYFDKLSQFIASMETSDWNGFTSGFQGFLMLQENVIFLKLSIMMTLQHVFLGPKLGPFFFFQTMHF